jgi:3-phenylpropionate/trans-cinnamate dioxygenase ferredoxin component
VQIMLRWLQVAQVGEIADREWKVISVNGSDIALFNVNDQYFAIDETLTHLSGGPSADSFDGSCVMNSWHASEPGTAAGNALKEHAYEGARTFPVRVRDGIIEVGEEAG